MSDYYINLPVQELSVSHVACFICKEPLRYGNSSLVSSGKYKFIFHCRCPDQLVMNDKCATCGKAVECHKELVDAIRLRCTCGHTSIERVDRLDTTTCA